VSATHFTLALSSLIHLIRELSRRGTIVELQGSIDYVHHKLRVLTARCKMPLVHTSVVPQPTTEQQTAMLQSFCYNLICVVNARILLTYPLPRALLRSITISEIVRNHIHYPWYSSTSARPSRRYHDGDHRSIITKTVYAHCIRNTSLKMRLANKPWCRDTTTHKPLTFANPTCLCAHPC
jgi:hypothetical protein